MHLKEFLHHANWLAIGVAALSYFILGAIWYSALFQKPWMAGHNLQKPTTPEGQAAMKKQMPMLMINSLFMSVAVAVIIGMVVMAVGSVNCMAGIKLGLALSVLGAIPLVMSHMYLMKSFKMWVIDGGYHVVGYTIMTIIISIWHK